MTAQKKLTPKEIIELHKEITAPPRDPVKALLVFGLATLLALLALFALFDCSSVGTTLPGPAQYRYRQ